MEESVVHKFRPGVLINGLSMKYWVSNLDRSLALSNVQHLKVMVIITSQ